MAGTVGDRSDRDDRPRAGGSPRFQLARDILAAGIRHASTVAAGIVTVGLIARRCGAEGLGAWAMMATMCVLLALCDLGLTTAVHRSAVTPDDARTRRFVGLTLLVSAVLSPLVAVASYIFLLDLPDASPALRLDASRASLVVLAGGVIAALSVPYRAFLLVRGGIRALAGAKALGAAFQVLLTAGGLYFTTSLLAPAVGLFVGLLLESALTTRAARAIDPSLPLTPRLPESRAEIAGAFHDGSASLAINLAVSAAVRLDVFILARTAPLAVVASYGIASRAVDQSYLFAKQASAALLPKLGNPRERDAAAELGTAVLGGLGASGLIALALCGTPLLVLWAGPMAASPHATTALALLAAATILQSAVEVVSSTVTLGAKTPWMAARPIVFAACVKVAISLLGARAFGVWALAGGSVVGNVILTVRMWSRARALLGWTRVRVVRALAPVVAAGGASLLVGALLSRVVGGRPLVSLAVCAGVTLAGCVAAFLVSFLVGGEHRGRDADCLPAARS